MKVFKLTDPEQVIVLALVKRALRLKPEQDVPEQLKIGMLSAYALQRDIRKQFKVDISFVGVRDIQDIYNQVADLLAIKERKLNEKENTTG